MQIFSHLSVPLGFELRLNKPSNIYQRPTNFLRLLQLGPAPVPTQCWGRFYRSSLRLGQKKTSKIGKIWHPWYVKLNSPAAKPVGARHSGPGVPLAAREARFARGRPPHPALPPAARQHLLRALPACPRRSASPGTTQTPPPGQGGREGGRPARRSPPRARGETVRFPVLSPVRSSVSNQRTDSLTRLSRRGPISGRDAALPMGAEPLWRGGGGGHPSGRPRPAPPHGPLTPPAALPPAPGVLTGAAGVATSASSARHPRCLRPERREAGRRGRGAARARTSARRPRNKMAADP